MTTGDLQSPPGAPPPPASAPQSVPNGTTQVTPPANYAAATAQGSKLSPEQQDQRNIRHKALPGIMAALHAVPGNRPDRWVQATYAIANYPVATATSLKYSALHATRNTVTAFDHAVEVTLSHPSLIKASAKDKADLVARVRSLLSPDTPICFDTDAPFPAEFEAFMPQIIGLQHSSNLRAGVIHHRMTVGFASADARDAALATARMLTWHSAKARFTKTHQFHPNMVELKLNVGVSGAPSKEEIVAALQSVVQDLCSKGHMCQLVQILRVIAVDNTTAYAHTVGDFSAFVHFDDATLFQHPTTILRDILPSRMNLRTRGIDVTALRHDYEKEAACVRCHFAGHVNKCPVVQERKRQEAEALVRKGVREGAGVGAEEPVNHNNMNNTNSTNTIPKAVAPGRALGASTIESRNRFAGLEVEGEQEDEGDAEEKGQEDKGSGQAEEGEDDTGAKADDEDSGMDSEASTGMDVIIKVEGKNKDEDELEVEVEREVEDVDADDKVDDKDDDADEEGGTTTEVDERTLTESGLEEEELTEREEQEDRGEHVMIIDDDDTTTTTTTLSREFTPRESTLEPLSPATLTKSLRESEEWDRARAQRLAALAKAEEDRRIKARLDTEEPLVRHGFATWDEEDGELRNINVRGTATKPKKMKRSQTVADLSDPSDEPADIKRVVIRIKGKGRAGQDVATEGRRVTRSMSAAAAMQVGVIKMDRGKGKCVAEEKRWSDHEPEDDVLSALPLFDDDTNTATAASSSATQ